jgi:hypothetical protein
VGGTYAPKIIFEVKLDNSKSVYMCLNEPTPKNEWFVVHVDSFKFLELWKNEPHNFNHHLSHGNPESWIKDYKFHHAVVGFSSGISNPVPLATVTCQMHKGSRPIYRKKFRIFNVVTGYESFEFAYADFINGITRTIWLLTHGAKWFPVICYTEEEAKLLSQVAGIDSKCLYPVSYYASLVHDHNLPTQQCI